MRDGFSRTRKAMLIDWLLCARDRISGGDRVSMTEFAYSELDFRYVFMLKISCFASFEEVIHSMKSVRIRLSLELVPTVFVGTGCNFETLEILHCLRVSRWT